MGSNYPSPYLFQLNASSGPLLLQPHKYHIAITVTKWQNFDLPINQTLEQNQQTQQCMSCAIKYLESVCISICEKDRKVISGQFLQFLTKYYIANGNTCMISCVILVHREKIW